MHDEMDREYCPTCGHEIEQDTDERDGYCDGSGEGMWSWLNITFSHGNGDGCGLGDGRGEG
jgi:hypothetical protein